MKAQWLAYSLPNPAAQGSILSVPKIFEGKNRRHCCSEETLKWLESVARTHLVLANGKLALRKVF